MTAQQKLTAKQMLEIYNVEISPQKLGAFRRKMRRDAGPPFRFSFQYAPRALSAEEEAEWAAQAEYEDDMGILGRPDDGEGYTVLEARNLEDAKVEAERMWQTEPHEGAIGYSICSRDWSSKYSFHVDLDNVVMLGDVRSR